MRLTCPHCSQSLGAEVLVGDACARELLGRLTGQPGLAGELLAYLALFRPRTQSLRWSRALALADEVLGWGAPEARLIRALGETVEAFREKRRRPDWKPLKNHHYLRAVYQSSDPPTLPPSPGSTPESHPERAAVRRSHVRNEAKQLRMLIERSEEPIKSALVQQLDALKVRHGDLK